VVSVISGVHRLAAVLGADADLPEAAAWLHEFGYTADLATTGLHALDGARYLRDAQHADAMLCRGRCPACCRTASPSRSKSGSPGNVAATVQGTP
jgi:hypothetical protein